MQVDPFRQALGTLDLMETLEARAGLKDPLPLLYEKVRNALISEFSVTQTQDSVLVGYLYPRNPDHCRERLARAQEAIARLNLKNSCRYVERGLNSFLTIEG